MVDEGSRLRRTQLVTSFADIAAKWWLIVPTVVGAMSGYAAYLTGPLTTYAPLSWFAVGVVGALIVAVLIWVGIKAAETFARWNYFRKIGASLPTFNPLDAMFTRRQIKLSDFRNPFNQMHEGKTFSDCEIIGPSVLYFDGTTNIHGVQFVNCDFVAVRDGAQVHNVLVFRDAVLRGGKMYGVTLLFPVPAVAGLNRQVPGLNWIT